MTAFIFAIPVPMHPAEESKIDFVYHVKWEEERYYLINHLKYNSNNGMDLFYLDS